MKSRAVALALLVVLGTMGVVGTPVPSGERDTASAATATPTNDTSMGSKMSSFMQASAGEASAAVDAGMWEAGFENAAGKAAKAAAVRQRVEAVRNRLDRLRQRKRTLVRKHRNGTITTAEFRARMSNVVGQLAALNRSLSELADRARAVGANVSKVRQLQRRVGDVARGLSNVTRSIPGGPPSGIPGANRTRGNGPNGPGNGPNDPGNGPNDPGNGPNGPGNDSGGPNGPGNKTAGPNDPGNDGNGSNGPGNDSGGPNGPGNKTAGPNDPGNDGNGPNDSGNKTQGPGEQGTDGNGNDGTSNDRATPTSDDSDERASRGLAAGSTGRSPVGSS